MPTIKLEIATPNQTETLTKTVTGQHLVRFIDAWRLYIGRPDATDSEVIREWGKAILQFTNNVIQEQERFPLLQQANNLKGIDFT